MALLMAGALSLGGLAAASAVLATAAVPTFPDNVVVFPDRDFVTVEGYQDHIGETATVEVSRGGTIVGSARSIVSEGDVAFEINHPGGVCWGDGTNLKVTPDIRAGDKVTIKFGGTAAGDTTVSTGTATTHAELSASTVTVTGTYGTDVDPAQVEVRIVNPDLTALIGRRDVRAVPGPLTPAPKGGYSSSLEMAGGTFTARYEFVSADAARIAASTKVERFMSWQVEDADANRQGLTISEFGELGGPGMGGCPAGPGDVAPPKASYTATRSTADKTKLAVKWTPAEPIPGAAAITGYSVEALKADNTLVGARTAATATGVTLTVDPAVADYSVEVRTMAGATIGDPFTLAPQTGTGELPADQTVPILNATPAAGDTADTAVEASTVSLLSESAADVYFTTNGAPVVEGDLPTDTAQLYRSPIAVGDLTEVHAVAIDRAGNISKQVLGFYKKPIAEQPGSLTPPVLSQPTGTDLGKTSVKLTWAKVDNATGYQVTAATDAGVALPATQQPGETTNLTQTVAGLAGSRAYRFTVVAINAAGKSDASNEVRALTTENLTVGTAKWKASDFRITGTSSALNGTVTVYRVNADGTAGTQIGTLQATLTTAAPPAAGTTYDWRLRAGVPTTNPGRVIVRSSNGAITAPFTVTNG